MLRLSTLNPPPWTALHHARQAGRGSQERAPVGQCDKHLHAKVEGRRTQRILPRLTSRKCCAHRVAYEQGHRGKWKNPLNGRSIATQQRSRLRTTWKGLGRRRQTSIPPWQGSRLSSSLLAQPARTPHASHLTRARAQRLQLRISSENDSIRLAMSGFGSARLPAFTNHRFGTEEGSLTQASRDILSDHALGTARDQQGERCLGDGERPASDGIGQTCC